MTEESTNDHVAVDEVLDQAEPQEQPEGSVSEPAKVMRIGSMIRQLLEEVRLTELDEPGRARLREIYDTSITELSSALSPDLTEELVTLSLPFGDESVPTDAELRIAQAQLVGWLEGLFHGIQATLFAQQMEAKQQQQQLAPGGQHQHAPAGTATGQGEPTGRSGVYL